MSDQNQNEVRSLRLQEESLVRALLRHVTGGEPQLRQLKRAQVRERDDGGIGSVKFGGDKRRCLGSCLIEAEYLDRDGVPVSIALHLDTNGLLYELDMWKVDFALLQEYSDFKQVTIKA